MSSSKLLPFEAVFLPFGVAFGVAFGVFLGVFLLFFGVVGGVADSPSATAFLLVAQHIPHLKATRTTLVWTPRCASRNRYELLTVVNACLEFFCFLND